MNKLLTFILFLFSTFSLMGQGVFMDNASVHVQNDASVTIQGDLTSENNSFVENYGVINLRDNLINNGGNTLFTNEDAGTVFFYGDNQYVDGSDTTVFYNLYFDGAYHAQKEFRVSGAVLHEFDLNDQVLETRGNILYHLNPDAGSFFFVDGYASSENLGGYLVRATDAQEEYIFPVGQTSLIPNLRPVIVTPNDSQNNLFGVRLSPYDVDTDVTGISASGAEGPFPRNDKDAALGELNNRFYHNIFLFSGSSSADIEVLFASGDGDYKTMAQWKNNQHIDAGFEFSVINEFGLDRKVLITDFADYDDDVFTLADLEIEIRVPGGVSPDGDGKNDYFYIRDLEYFPENELVIFNRWGDMIYKAAPYLNDWDGESNASGTVGSADVVAGTYYYVLKLKEGGDPIKGFFELKK